ncbi:molybdopterin-dependent oxidoreductase-like protein [Hasllibacter halocynthiae]|uniref:Molybdopterin-dependent oxidoreductase-like protein n=1 Tax=Hasllibacter halocynthiae TaxID=595589 RepID=A0A2T0X6U1_9RHOB|nr:molybdopterin oxidoreductase family protein [Hasllibacter halocynthiae]PRY94605.1 molybdopterin-dependent oxidoreductase-like protein [Hasllibacter halocynthiae]
MGHHPNLTPRVGDEVRKTTCYMCACRCGIDVHVRDGPGGGKVVTYIEGNRDHPVNRGVLCAKGSAGLMQHHSPARLRAPLRRVGERGEGRFEEITWEEALDLAASWLAPVRESDPKKLAFFTGRDQSQSFTSWWAQAFGTPNYAAHGGFCSVNMAAGGIYTLGGAFWEFGQPDWDRAKLFLLFGVAEDHDSNPIKMGIGRLKGRGGKIVGINPVRTGYNAVADDWYGITPGTDGLLVLSLIHLLLKAGRIDADYLARWTNAPVLLDGDPESPDHLLPLTGEDGEPLVIDRRTGRPAPWNGEGVRPLLTGTLDRGGHRHESAFHRIAGRYLADDYAPEAVEGRTGIPAARIRQLAGEIARAAFEDAEFVPGAWTDFRGERHEGWQARPVAMHAMRGVSAHANGFQTARAIHLLQALIGSVEAPGGFRFKPPYPKPVDAHPRPHANAVPGQPLDGPHLGYPRGPEDLLVGEDGGPKRIDKAYSWDAPLAAHGLMHMVLGNAAKGDPYGVDVVMMYMANMAWNSSMSPGRAMEALTARGEDGGYRIPKVIYSDAYASEMVAYADLILPDTTYLERHDCISLLDRPICEADAAADAIRWPVVEPGREVRGFQTALVQLGAKLGLPGFVEQDGTPAYADYADYIQNHERRPGVGPLAGWRGDGKSHGRGGPNPEQIERYKEAGGFWTSHVPEGARYMKPFNAGYQDWAVGIGLFDVPQPYLFELWSAPLRRFQLAAEGKRDPRPPEDRRAALHRQMDPLPVWWDCAEANGAEEYPLHALTQRPMAMYHSWGSQNAWLRQIHGTNPLFIPPAVAEAEGLRDGDWARVTSPHGEITVPVQVQRALNPRTVWTWNAIGKRKRAWGLDADAPEATKGFLMNHLIHELLPPKGGQRFANSDPVTGQAAWFDLRVRVEKAEARAQARPVLDPLGVPPVTGDGRPDGARREPEAEG